MAHLAGPDPKNLTHVFESEQTRCVSCLEPATDFRELFDMAAAFPAHGSGVNIYRVLEHRYQQPHLAFDGRAGALSEVLGGQQTVRLRNRIEEA